MSVSALFIVITSLSASSLAALQSVLRSAEVINLILDFDPLLSFMLWSPSEGHNSIEPEWKQLKSLVET